MLRCRPVCFFAVFGLLPLAAVAPAQEPTPAAAEFFEKQVRPLLAERCFECHGDKKMRGGLKVTSRSALLQGGDSGPAAVAQNPDQSLLIRAVRYQDELRMPPKAKLKDQEIATLTRWVQMGLPWPQTATVAQAAEKGKFQITEEQRRFWAFQPVQSAPLPSVKDAAWPRSGLDRFILAALEAKDLRPATHADRRTLLRRATFDLTGLPPTPRAIDEFLRDESPDAFARVVDRLLASPHYGERWGRHWLDVARYADSHDARILNTGREMDITEAWRYRDWVIDAFNRDLPYNQFVMQQLAGDLLPPPAPTDVNRDGIVATGILAIGNWGGGDADKEKMVTDIVDDQLDIVGRVFLGLTLTCARCHDHKFDPISTEDYYGLGGIFFSTHILPNVGPRTNGPPMLRIPLLPPAEVAQREKPLKRIAELEKELKKTTEAKDVRAQLTEELAALKKTQPPPIPLAHGAQEGGIPGSPHAGIHDVRIHVRGSYLRLGDLVPRRFPQVLAGDAQPPITKGSGRLELAQWLTRPEHPLTARVMVNRIWQQHFGEGLVRTPSNFGKLGQRPTHPELLDWLTRRFVESGWSMKQMHRLILMSATYQQSSEGDAETVRQDPDNRLWGRMSRRRLEAEEIRDNLLAVADRLDRSMGGPATRDFASPRRTLYQMTVRSDRSGFGPLFDTPDSTSTAERRQLSTVAPQALFLLNHPFILDQTQTLARRILGEAQENQERIQKAYVLLYGRPAAAEEVQIGLDFLARAGTAERAWEEYCQVLLCANEFIYVD